MVGAGITGALIARELCRAGFDCVVLDRRTAGLGSTAASTAILQYELDTPLVDLALRMGESDAAWVYRSCVDAVRAFCRLAPDGAVTERPSLYLASSSCDAELLEREWRARRAAGIDVDFLTASQIADRFSFRREAALWSRTAAETDPLSLTRLWLDEFRAQGGRVYDRTTVCGLTQESSGVLLRTERGPTVRARRVVLATGYETVPELQRWAPAQIVSTYALATEPLTSFPGWAERCIIWETARPYFYARTAGARAIIGGEDIATSYASERDALIGAKSKRLLGRLNALFPDLRAQVGTAWAGTFGQSPDGLPYIAPAPASDRVMLAIGLGGNGMVFAMIASRIVAAWCSERPCPESRLFGFDRAGLSRRSAGER